MRKKSTGIRTILIVSIILLPEFLYAQVEKQLTPSEIKQQTIVTEPVTLKKGFFRAGSLMNYRVADKYFTDDGIKEYYLSNIWGSNASYNITFQYGISDRFELEIVTEYMNSRQESQKTEYVALTNTTREILLKKKGTGIGDSYARFRYQLLPESKYRISLTGIAWLAVPTGKKNPTDIVSSEQYDLPVGNGTYAVTGGLFARTILYPYSFTFLINYTYSFSGNKKFEITDLREIKFKPGDIIEASLSANLHLNEWIVFSNELYYQNKDKGRVNERYSHYLPLTWSISYEPGLIFQVKRFRLGETVTIPLKGRNSAADPLYCLMLQYIF
ncbi:MAG: transporter [Bacteroidales bacterium]